MPTRILIQAVSLVNFSFNIWNQKFTEFLSLSTWSSGYDIHVIYSAIPM